MGNTFAPILIATSLSVSAKWSKSPIGLYDLVHSKGAKIIDISYPDGQNMSKVFTTL